MRDFQRFYKDLVRNGAKKGQPPGFTAEDAEGTALQALICAVARDAIGAKKHLAELGDQPLEGLALATRLEAEMLLAFQAREIEKARELAQRAVDANPSAFFAWYTLALLNGKSDLAESMRILDQLLASYPDQEECLYAGAKVMYTLGFRKEALRYLKTAKNSIRKVAYIVVIELFSGWFVELMGFILLALMIYTPPVTWPAFILVSAGCIAVLVDSFRRNEPFLFYSFLSIQFIAVVLLVTHLVLS